MVRLSEPHLLPAKMSRATQPLRGANGCKIPGGVPSGAIEFCKIYSISPHQITDAYFLSRRIVLVFDFP